MHSNQGLGGFNVCHVADFDLEAFLIGACVNDLVRLAWRLVFTDDYIAISIGLGGIHLDSFRVGLVRHNT